MASVSRLPSIRQRNRPVSMIEDSTPNVASDGDMSKRFKRRSLLPQFNRKESAEEKPDLGIVEEDGDSASRSVSIDTRGSDESSSRRGIDEDRKAMPPPVQTSRLSRPASMIPPRGASQFARTKSYPTPQPTNEEVDSSVGAEDARAQSLAALTGASPATPSKLAMPTPGLQRAGSTKLPQSPRVGGPAIPSRTTSNRPGHAQGNPATTTLAEKRSSVVRARPTSQAEHATNNGAGRASPKASMMSRGRPMSQLPGQPASPPRASTSTRSRPTSQMLPPPKPTFNTYQQHYSPAKSALPKPPVPSAKGVKSSTTIDEPNEVTSDVAKLQIELLQLSLVHQASGKCMQEYEASARRKLGKKHTKLRKDYESIRTTELVQQRTTNLSALETWCRDPGMLVENLQILSLVYSDLTSLIEDGSRHGNVVGMFELWMTEAEACEPGSFIRPLPDDWKAAHASLALKLRSIQRNLGVLPPPRGDDNEMSGLASVLRWCKALVDAGMKELEVMVKLEKELLVRERSRLEEDVKALILDDVGMQPVWRPAWQEV